jgi:F-type H+-transporting ATPase subunit b
MNQILNQLGGLILGSVPTIVFFLLLLIAYALLVRRPLDAILAERRKRTIGAVEQARGAISAAEAETAVFEDKLRAAKLELMQLRERKLKALAGEREAALGETRTSTQAKVLAAKLEIERSATSARQQIEGMSEQLSAQVLAKVLPAGAVAAQ